VRKTSSSIGAAGARQSHRAVRRLTEVVPIPAKIQLRRDKMDDGDRLDKDVMRVGMAWRWITVCGFLAAGS